MVRYIRMTRASTGSWITYKLPKKMDSQAAFAWAEEHMSEWEGSMCCLDNPDLLSLCDQKTSEDQDE